MITMPINYETIGEFLSKSTSGKVYTVKRDLATGQLSCNCPIWVYNRNGDRTCYHTMKVLAQHTAIKGVMGLVPERIEPQRVEPQTQQRRERPRKLRLS